MCQVDENEQLIVREMLRQEAGAFARADDDVVCVEYLKLEIQLKDNEPLQKNYSSIPKPLYGEVKEYLEDPIDGNLICKSLSAYLSSMMVCVRKKDESLRLCIDYAQLTDHVRTHLEERFQSTYRIHHSTGTALVKVHNDSLRAIDDNRSVLLLLLDLSATFDTVDHSTLLLSLRTRFCVKGSALAWFESYLASRKYHVQVEGYVLYTFPVAYIIKSHDLQYHFYADDTQLYITFKTDSADDACLAKSRVAHCVEEILFLALNSVQDPASAIFRLVASV